ncbi:MAG: T9SS type A sorting domain-containing protein [Saprospiraceae bacterium]|nr:T9SS type A sorting domain-containing protein [Saprospiraceae bacterium]
MKNKILLTLLLLANIISAQDLRRILVLNEGRFDFNTNQIAVPVSVGAFDINTKQYSKLLEIDGARFATDIKIDGNSYWVAADQELLQYDLTTNQKIKSTTIKGIRRFAFYKDLIVVSLGEYLTKLNSNILVLDKNTLAIKHEVPFNSMPFTTESIIIKDDKAFIAANNGFEWGKEVGKILELDLINYNINQVIDLGANAKNPENLVIYNDKLYTVNNKDYTGSSITAVDLTANTVSTVDLPSITSLCGTSALVEDAIYYQESGKSVIGKYSISSQSAAVYKDVAVTYYGMTYDPKSKLLVASETDFVSKGVVYVIDQSENIQHKFTASVSPGNFAFDYTTVIATEDIKTIDVKLAPNPATHSITIQSDKIWTSLELINAIGQKIKLNLNQNQIDISTLSNGFYTLKGKNNSEIFQTNFVKQ